MTLVPRPKLQVKIPQVQLTVYGSVLFYSGDSNTLHFYSISREYELLPEAHA
jgi:hypothetical protein